VKPGFSAALADPGVADGSAFALARALGVSITLADVLTRAGRAADDDTRRFLDPKLAHLTPPHAMAGRDAAAERIARAIRARERVCVFGDYDCDGITAAAIVTGVVRALGGEATPLLATRLEGAYGLSWPALERVRKTGATLLVTCDCGSSDHERLWELKRAGVDVVVIDHHLVPAEPLPALAFLNPHRDDCGFPFKWLASCGLALSVGAALRQALGASLDLRDWLDLVAIGTVADVAPLTGDNRALVRAGLGVLASGRRPGLRALAELARIELSQVSRADDIAFRIAPRINAPGRIGSPDDALELLLARDPARAAELASIIEQAQARRREVQDIMEREAIEEIASAGFAADPAIVLARQGWHPGVVGIVAGRVATLFGKPAIVVALEGAEGRGSVRGPEGFRLYDALTACRAELVGFGGHQAAAGVHVRAERVGALRDAWRDACRAQRGDDAAPAPSEADVRLDDRDDPAVVARDLERLEPCGEANRAPFVLLRGARVREARIVKGHLKLDLAFGPRRISAFGFQLGALQPELTGATLDVIGRLRRDTFRGGDAVELRVERIARRGGP
jgi:single-stranded-DNA-specific exonuclease